MSAKPRPFDNTPTPSASGVTTFNGRSGAVTLQASDITSAGGVTGGPYLPLTGGTLSGQVNSNSSIYTTGSTIQSGDWFVCNSPPGFNEGLFLQASGLQRWLVGTDGTAEGGSNAGTNFSIYSYNDAGNNLGIPLSINRATGNATFSGQVTSNGNILSNGGTYVASAAAGTYRGLEIETAGVVRWFILSDSAAEGGSNSGSNFAILNYSDTGVNLGSPLTINRATGNATFSGIITSQSNSWALEASPPAGYQAGVLLNIQAGQPGVIASAMPNGFRWRVLLGDGGAETGGNAGSNFILAAYNDSGVGLANYFTIARANGATTFNTNSLILNAPTGLNSQFGMYFPASGTGAQIYSINATASAQRWLLSLGDGSTETGTGNAGSNFVLTSYSDAGASLGAALTIARGTRNATFGGTVTATGFTSSGLMSTAGYTVAGLPAAGVAGRRAYVTDASAPTFLGTLTGGGSIHCPVFDNGTAWVAG